MMLLVKKYLLSVTLVLSVIICSGFVASAALIDSIRFEPVLGSDVMQKIIIEGRISVAPNSLEVDRQVSLEFLRPNVITADIKVKPKAFKYVAQTTADSITGAYKFEFKNKNSGTFLARIGFKGMKSTDQNEKTFVFVNPTEVPAFLNSISQASSSNDIAKLKEIVDSSIASDFITLPFYELIKQKAYDTAPIFSTIAKQGTFLDVPSFITAFNQATALQIINCAANQDALKETFNNTLIKSILVFENGPMETYDTVLTETERNTVLGQMVKKYSTVNEIVDTFSIYVVRYAISHRNWQETYNILENNNDILKMDFTKYNTLSDKNAILKLLVDNCADFTSVSQLVGAFNGYVDTQISNNQPRTISKGGWGGGSVVVKEEKINIVVQPTPPLSPTFKDLESIPWAKESIEKLAELKVISGNGDGLFNPKNKVTREEFLKMLISAFNLLDTSATCDFKDVVKNDWYYSYIASAKKLGISNGLSDEEFGVGVNITRQDMVTMAFKTLNLKNVKIPSVSDNIVFTDDNRISLYAKDAVKAMQGAGIVKGIGDKVFAPGALSTRAEAAKIIYGLIGLVGNI